MVRDTTADIAKGIGIVFVVIGHLNHFFSYESLVPTIIYSFHMPLFIFLSGYVFNYHAEISAKEYCYKRFGRIIRPYFLFAAITFIYDCVRNGVIDVNGIYGIFIGNGIDNHLNFNIALWFLPMLFLCNLVFWYLVKLSKKCKKESISYGILVICSMFVTMFGYYLISHQKRFLWGIETALFSQFFMLLGYLFKLINNRYYDNKRYRKISICCCPIIAVIWWPGGYLMDELI